MAEDDVESCTVLERDMRECGLKREDAQGREKWRKLLWEAAGQPLCKWGNGRKTIVVLLYSFIIYDQIHKSNKISGSAKA